MELGVEIDFYDDGVEEGVDEDGIRSAVLARYVANAPFRVEFQRYFSGTGACV